MWLSSRVVMPKMMILLGCFLLSLVHYKRFKGLNFGELSFSPLPPHKDGELVACIQRILEKRGMFTVKVAKT